MEKWWLSEFGHNNVVSGQKPDKWCWPIRIFSSSDQDNRRQLLSEFQKYNKYLNSIFLQLHRNSKWLWYLQLDTLELRNRLHFAKLLHNSVKFTKTILIFQKCSQFIFHPRSRGFIYKPTSWVRLLVRFGYFLRVIPVDPRGGKPSKPTSCPSPL